MSNKCVGTHTHLNLPGRHRAARLLALDNSLIGNYSHALLLGPRNPDETTLVSGVQTGL